MSKVVYSSKKLFENIHKSSEHQLKSKMEIMIVTQARGTFQVLTRLDSNIESKSSNNTYLNIIKIFNKLSKK